MSVLILSIYNNPEQIISSAKIYEQNINQDVYFLNCSNALKFCDINPDNEFKKCFDCIVDRFFIFNLLNIPNNKLINIGKLVYSDIDIPIFKNIEELKDFKYDNISFGLYAYNSISSIIGKEDFSIKFSRHIIKTMLIESINLYNKVSKIIDEIKPDEIYIYKDQNIIYKPLEELCNKKNINTNIFYVNNSIVEIYNTRDPNKINPNIFIEKIDDEYLINGQKINRFIYSRTKNELMRIINNYNNESFGNNVDTFKFLRDLEKYGFWNKNEIEIIQNKIVEIYNFLDKKDKEAQEEIKISACMIVKNEEKNLERCLKSIKDIADEIIVLDTGSTDKTIDIAKEYGCKVFNYEWSNDFSDARNRSISYAKNDWILTIDADEELTENTRKNLLRNIYDDPVFNEDLIFWFKCFNIYPDDQESTFYFKHFLFNKKHGFRFEGKVHEYLVNPNYKDKVLKKHCYQFVVNHYCDREKNKGKSKYYLELLEQELKNEETIKGKIVILNHLSNEYQKIGNNDKSLELALESYNLFQDQTDLKSTLSYISNLIEIAAALIFNHYKFEEAKKYIYEVFELVKDYNFPDALYLKALVEHYTKNYDEAINLYKRLINSFKSDEFDQETSHGLSSKGKTLYPLSVIELYKLYMFQNKEELALNILLDNENNYHLVSMFILKHFVLKKDLTNSLNQYFKINSISKEKKENLYNLISKNEYKQGIYQIIDELLDSQNIFSDDEKRELLINKNSV